MANGFLLAVSTTTLPSGAATLDTVRALCHDLRQPLAAIRLLAGAESGDVQGRFDGILEQAEWLSDMVEDVIGGAADDRPTDVDVADLTFRCVLRARPTAPCQIGFFGTDQTMVVGAPVALSRAVSCLLDNAVRAAGEVGRVIIVVSGTDSFVTIRVIDDGPGLGHVPTNNSLGLTIARALVSACGGAVDLKPGITGGAVAQIVLPAISSRVSSRVSSRAMAS
ncbi:MAG TPA: HAMP domain-containing sensor histidine kinase [Dermatophilaceae bacterium]